MTYSKQLKGLVDDLSAMRPSGVIRLAAIMGRRKQGIYLWRKRDISDKSAWEFMALAKASVEEKRREMHREEREFADRILEKVEARLRSARAWSTHATALLADLRALGPWAVAELAALLDMSEPDVEALAGGATTEKAARLFLARVARAVRKKPGQAELEGREAIALVRGAVEARVAAAKTEGAGS